MSTHSLMRIIVEVKAIERHYKTKQQNMHTHTAHGARRRAVFFLCGRTTWRGRHANIPVLP